VARWRLDQSLRRTLERRPELLEKADLPPEARRMLEGILAEEKRKGLAFSNIEE
jgi:tRNA (guanine37-N1)-methyltransferase